jgi:hypothetical protein
MISMSDDLASLQAQLDALKSAYYSGARKLSYEGKNIEYGSGEEMRAAIASLEAAIGNGSPVRTIAVRSTKGW